MTKPYQPSFSIQPTYGFRYMSQPFADNVSSGYTPPNPNYIPPKPKVQPDYVPPQVNNQAVMDTSDSNNPNAEISKQMSLDVAPTVAPRDYDAEEKGIFNKGEVFNPSPKGMLSAITPFGLGSFTEPAIPAKGYGSEGSISGLTGGVFQGGRSYDPITGYAKPEFASTRAFTNYMIEDPFANTFGDKNNQFVYNRDKDRPNPQAQEFQFAMAKSPLAEGGVTEAEKDTIAKKIGVDAGIAESSLQGQNNPTISAIKGEGYIDGAAPKGSQFSSTGTFSSGTVDYSDPIGSTTDNSSYDSNEDSSYSDSGGYSDSIDTGGFSRGGKVQHLSQGGQVFGGK